MTILEIYKNAILAQISYVNGLSTAAPDLKSYITNNANGAEDVTINQASYYTDNFTLLSQQSAGVNVSGFSASVFQENESGEIYFAMRGTDVLPSIGQVLYPSGDWHENVFENGINGIAANQVLDMINYYLRLVTSEDEYVNQYSYKIVTTLYNDHEGDDRYFLVDKNVQAGVTLGYDWLTLEKTNINQVMGLGILEPDQKFHITGHSLGGHLASVFTLLFPDVKIDLTTFNSAGIVGVFGNDLPEYSKLFDSSILELDINTFNLIPTTVGNVNDFRAPGDPVSDIVTSTDLSGDEVEIQVEEVPGFLNFDNHSQDRLVDTFAVMAALEHLDSTINLQQANYLMNQANVDDLQIETVAAALSEILGVGTVAVTSGDHDYVYELVNGILENSEINDQFSIDSFLPSDVDNALSGDKAALYAIINRNTFVVRERFSQTFYQNLSSNIDLNVNNYSEQYLRDSSEYILSFWNYAQVDGELQEDGNAYISRINGQVVYFYNAEGVSILAGGNASGQGNTSTVNRNDGRNILFGDDGSDSLIGRGFSDSLYGMSGSDSLTGGQGDDYLEGGKDKDSYYFSYGSGSDTIFDSDHSSNNDIYLEHISGGGQKLLSSLVQVSPGSSIYYETDESGNIVNRSTSYLLRPNSIGNSDLIININSGKGGQVFVKDFIVNGKNNFGVNIEELSSQLQINAIYRDTTSTGTLVIDQATFGPYAEWSSALDFDTQEMYQNNPNFYDTWYDYSLTTVLDLRDWNVLESEISTYVGDIFYQSQITVNRPTILNLLDFNTIRDGAIHQFYFEDIVYLHGGDDIAFGSNIRDGSSSLLNETIFSSDDDYIDGGDGRDILLGESISLDYYYLSGFYRQGFPLGGLPGVLDYEELLSISDDSGSILNYVHHDNLSEIIYEPRGNDILIGGQNSDTVFGDLLSGAAGNDTLIGDSAYGYNWLLGGVGSDSIYGGEDVDRIFGDNEAVNILESTYSGHPLLEHESPFAISGRSRLGAEDAYYNGFIDAPRSDHTYDDLISSGGGDDFVEGGLGEDTIRGEEGNDILIGDRLNNVLFYSDLDSILYTDISSDLHRSDSIYGGSGADLILGNGGDDYLDGGDGTDIIYGDDFISNGQHHGNDEIFGGAGDDILVGGDGLDSIQGGTGDDWIGGDNQFRSFRGIASGSLLFDSIQPHEVLNSDLSVRASYLLEVTGSDDFIVGGDGDDIIFGDGGNDTLIGGLGTDLLVGGTGLDSYYFEIGGGTDYVDDDSIAEINISAPIRSVNRVSDTRTIISYGVRGSSDYIVLLGDSISSIENITAFETDIIPTGIGSSYDQDVILINSGIQLDFTSGIGNDFIVGGVDNDNIHGGDGSDILFGGFGNDILNGGGGGDILSGGGGSDEYHVDLSLGSVNINNIQTVDAGLDSVIFEAESSLEDISLSRESDDLVVSFSNQAHKLTVENYFLDSGRLANFVFSDASVLSSSEIDALFPSNNNIGDDIYIDSIGDDVYSDEGGNDEYMFDINDDLNAINDLAGANEIVFADGVQRGDLNFSRTFYNDLLVSFVDRDGTIQILNYFGSENAAIFSFTLGTADNASAIEYSDITNSINTASIYDDSLFGDTNANFINGLEGDDYLLGFEGNDNLAGGSGDDIIEGGIGNDLIDGGKDNDYLLGGEGDNTYYFEVGHGQDTIDQREHTTGINIVEFSAEIEPNNVTLSKNGSDLLIETGVGNTIHILGYQQDTVYTISEIRFHDETWDSSKIEELLSEGTENNSPVAQDDSASTSENTSIVLYVADLLENDTDVDDGDVLSIASILNPVGGSVVLDSLSGTIIFNPDTGFIGTASFDYIVEDNLGASDMASVNVQVTAGETPLPTDVLIQAEDYIAYSDTTSGNSGGKYRADDVDIQDTSDIGGGYNIGWVTAGESLDYSANLEAGTYRIEARVASSRSSGAYNLSLNNQEIVSSIVPNTGGWQDWLTQDLGEITVSGTGQYTLQLNTTGPNFNLNWIRFVGVESSEFSNYAPIVNLPLADQSTSEDLYFNFTLPDDAFSDADGDLLSYSATLENGDELPEWLSFDSSTRTFFGTPLNEDVSVLDIRVSASDIRGSTISDDFSLTILNTNDAPTALDDSQTTNENIPVVISILDLISNDIDVDVGDTLTLTSVFNEIGGTATVDAERETITFTPYQDFYGDAGFQYEILDSSGAAAIASVDINVEPSSNAPQDLVIQAEDYIAFSDTTLGNKGETYRADDVDIQATTDVDGGYNIGWVTKNEWLDFSAGLESGTYRLEARVASARSTGAYSLSLDGELIGASTILNTGGWQSWVTQDLGEITVVGGEQVLRFEATSSNFNINWIRFVGIDVDGPSNVAPIVTTSVTDQYTAEDSLFNFTLPSDVFTDGDGDTLSFSALMANGDELPAWLSFDASTSSFSGTPLNEDVGIINVNVIADDGNGGSVAEDFTLTVNNTNDAPVAHDDNATTLEDSAIDLNVVDLLSNDSDQDVGDTLSVISVLNEVGGVAVLDSTHTTITFTPYTGFVGTAKFNYQIEDQSGDTDTGEVSINVTPLAHGPDTILVQAEHYVDYFDTSLGNNGGEYRDDDVDVQVTTDLDGGYNVGWVASGEWLEYTVDLEPGTYQIETRVASNRDTGAYNLSLDGVAIGSSTLLSTGGWQSWITQNLGEITVTGGEQTLRFDVTGANFNVNWIRFIGVQESDPQSIQPARFFNQTSSLIAAIAADSSSDALLDTMDTPNSTDATHMLIAEVS